MNHEEIEVKILEVDVAAVRTRLAELKAEPVFAGEMHAIFFDDSTGSFRATGSAIRLRREGDTAVLALKKRLRKDTAKVMDEKETAVGCFDTMRQILLGLGYKEIAETQKDREEMQIPESGAKVVIDHYQGKLAVIPAFVEIEAASEEIVLATAKLLGFTHEQCLSWDTRDLAAHYDAPI